jgi:NADH dehydrogenase
MTKKLVVVGGGYGGTEVIRQLLLRGTRNVEMELISKRTHFENTIGGAELISEKIKFDELRYSLKQLSGYWNFTFTVATVENIDFDNKILKTEEDEKTYDLLVVATGVESNFFDVKGTSLVQSAYHLGDFVSINQRLKQLSRDNPNIVVAGAGFVGLESTADILDLFDALKRRVNTTVVEKMPYILPAYNNASARSITHEDFVSRGVKFVLGKGVKVVEEGRVILDDGSHLDSDLTIWTAGIKGCLVESQVEGGELRRGCIVVDDKLLINGKEDAFAIGDSAFIRIGEKEAAKMAAEALEQAKTVAKNIDLIVKGEKPRFSYVPLYTTDSPVALFSMGRGKAMLILGPAPVSVGTSEYFLKKRIDFQEIMERFPQ